MDENERHGGFVLNRASRSRNKTALKTIKSLILLFTVTQAPPRLLLLLSAGIKSYTKHSKPLFTLLLSVYLRTLIDIVVLVLGLNYILNVFVYARLIGDFRRFLLNVFSFGFYARRRATR